MSQLNTVHTDITELDLSFKNISKLPKDYFLYYPNLKKLNLQGNQLIEISECIENLIY